MKPVEFSHHALMQLKSRGTNETEIIETIRNAVWQPAELNRMECRKNFEYNSHWNEKFFKTKQVRPIFTEEDESIIVVTVYVYYF